MHPGAEVYALEFLPTKHYSIFCLSFFLLSMKKIYISLLFVLFALTPFITTAENYSAELQSAYAYARSINITTMPSIDAADMNGKLIRSHMAKMMVNYAQEVLGKTADTSLSCNFSDVANQSEELK